MQIKIKSELQNFQKPLIMGILNLSPDSFYADSFCSQKEADEKIKKMFQDSADIIDIGAMSSNPNSKLISEKEEWQRLEPILELISKNFPEKIFSIDTFRSQIAKKAVLNYGISIINDISGGQFDNKMFETVALCQCPYILMHLQSKNYKNIHNNQKYQSIIENIIFYFSKKINELRQLGIPDIILDPGFGFSKTIDDNFYLLKNIEKLKIFKLPILTAISRKTMIWKTLNITPNEALNATTILNTISIIKGTNIIRVHDIKEARQCIDLLNNFQLF